MSYLGVSQPAANAAFSWRAYPGAVCSKARLRWSVRWRVPQSAAPSWPRSADSGGSAATDREILTYGLLIERLQAAFYAAALAGGQLTGEARQFAQVVAAQEQAHVKYRAPPSGRARGPAPVLRFGDSATDPAKFIATAMSLEETGLGVYNGQAVSLTPTTLAAAARIVSVEARHAAWARALDGKDPAPAAVDVPITVAQAKRTFGPFIVA